MAVIDLHIAAPAFLRRASTAELFQRLREFGAARPADLPQAKDDARPLRRSGAAQLPPVQSCQASIFRELRNREAGRPATKSGVTEEKRDHLRGWLRGPIHLFH